HGRVLPVAAESVPLYLLLSRRAGLRGRALSRRSTEAAESALRLRRVQPAPRGSLRTVADRHPLHASWLLLPEVIGVYRSRRHRRLTVRKPQVLRSRSERHGAAHRTYRPDLVPVHPRDRVEPARLEVMHAHRAHAV